MKTGNRSDTMRCLNRWIWIALLPFTQVQLVGAEAAAFIQNLIQSNDGIEITLTSINVNGATGYARFVNTTKVNIPPKPGGPFVAPHLHATADEFFNDRTQGTQPFDTAQADKVELNIKTNEVVLTLLSWNNGKIRFTPSLVENLLHGWSQDGKTYFVLHIKQNPPVL